MPSTTVHLPALLLSRVDQAAKDKRVSRNRFIIEACENALNNEAGQWPEGFFEKRLKKNDFAILHKAVMEMEEAIISRRRSRQRVDL